MTTIQRNDYLFLCGIRFCSSMVLWLDFVLIFTTLTFVFNAPAKTLALAASLYGIPALFLGPYFGSLADRYNPRKIIIISFFARAAAALLLFSSPSVDIFLVFVVFKGFSNLGSTSAEIVLTRKLLTTSEIVKNTSVVTVVDQSIKIISPVAAGFMASVGSQSQGFLLSAGVCIVGLFCVTVLPLCYKPTTQTNSSNNTNKRFIFRYFKRHSPARIFLYCMLIQSGALGLYDSLLGVFLREHGESSTAFGIIVSATALGGITSGLVFPRVYKKRSTHSSTTSSIIFGLSLVLIGIISFYENLFNLITLSILFLIAGFAYGLTAQGFTTTLQLTCPSKRLGATFATTRTLSIALFISFPALGGWLAEVSSTAYVLITAGAMTMLIACALRGMHSDRTPKQSVKPQGALS